MDYLDLCDLLSWPDASVWSAIAAFASASAAGFSAWLAFKALETSREQKEIDREHNRLSVLPELQFRPVGENQIAHRMGLFLANNGLGPARVTRIFMRDLSSGIEGSNLEIGAPLNAAFTRNHLVSVQGDILRVGRLIPAGALVEIFSVSHDYPHPHQVDAFLLQIEIQIEYQSLYQENRPPARYAPGV
jgi:hypothetical protein